jgi:TusA-related sulfurtransferase
MKKSDELVVICDHPSAATTSIPLFATENGMAVSSRKIESGLWEITLTKKQPDHINILDLYPHLSKL